MSGTVSSYIPTTGAVDTRTRDKLSFSLPTRPQVVTLYARFIESGNAVNASTVFVVAVGGGVSCLCLRWVGLVGYTCTYDNGLGAPVSSSMGPDPVIGDVVELRGTLASNGVVQCHQSINAATEVAATASGARPLIPAWSTDDIWFNSVGPTAPTAAPGMIKLMNVCLMRGVQSLNTMRREAGVW